MITTVNFSDDESLNILSLLYCCLIFSAILTLLIAVTVNANIIIIAAITSTDISPVVNKIIVDDSHV